MKHLRHVVFLCVVLPLTLSGCSESEDSSSQSAAPEAKSGTIGYSALTLTNPFFKIIADTMKEEAEKQGFELIVVAGDNDVKKQSDQIDDFISRGVEAIVLNPCDSKAIGPAIKRANDAGIPVFTNDIKYDGTEAEVVCHVATDNYQGGKLAGEAMVRLLEGRGGKVGILHYPDVESCQLRVKGFHEVVNAYNENHPDAKIIVTAELNGRGDRDVGNKAAQDLIQKDTDLAAIFAINDPSALGAYAALEAAGRTEQVKIIGFDGALEGKEAILEGKIVCDPVQYPRLIGSRTVEMIVKHFNGEEVPGEILIESGLYYQEDAQKDPELKSEQDVESSL
ncbi:MAG: substrate-binding domain-containing protein [Planctomycetaceae bacterium]|nr:substrate-binding domain-containing protein [Planctomycetaceae bacterium]